MYALMAASLNDQLFWAKLTIYLDRFPSKLGQLCGKNDR